MRYRHKARQLAICLLALISCTALCCYGASRHSDPDEQCEWQPAQGHCFSLAARYSIPISGANRDANVWAAARRLHGLLIVPGRPVGIVADALLPMRPVDALSDIPGYVLGPGGSNAAVCLGAGAQRILPHVHIIATQAGLQADWLPLSANSRLLLPFYSELRISAPDSALYYFAARACDRGCDVAVWRQCLPPELWTPSTSSIDRIPFRPVRRRYVIIAAVGDIMPGTSIQSAPASRQGVRGGSPAFTEIAQLTAAADIALGNLEAPITDAQQPTHLKTSRELASGREYVFKVPPATACALLQGLGIDAVSLANNHALDYETTGLRDTFRHLQAAGIKYAGAGIIPSMEHDLPPAHYGSEAMPNARKPALLQRNGLTVALLSYVEAETLPRPAQFAATAERPGLALIQLNEQGPTWSTRQILRADIRAARAAADVVIVGLHWGDEGSSRTRPGQRECAHFCIDHGADLVWGHHPHCLQPLELYRGRLIAYSLGNFVFATPPRPHLLRTGVLITCFDTSGLVAASLIPAVIAHPQVRLTGGPPGFPTIVSDSPFLVAQIRQDLGCCE